MALQIASFDRRLLQLINQHQNKEEIVSIVKKDNLYNVMDCSKNTLLHVAAQSANTEIIKHLINSGSIVDVQNNLGQTPLMLAIPTDSEETIKVLMEASVDIDVQDSLGKSALRIIGESELATDKLLGLFVKKLQKICLNDKDEIAKKLSDADWPLHYVVALKDTALTISILQFGYATKIDELGDFVQTALHEATKSLDVENVKILLEYNANVNSVDVDSRTTLSYLYNGNNDHYNKRLEILKLLLDNGANLLSIDPDDVFQAYQIFRFASREVIKLLLQSDVVKSSRFEHAIAVHNLAANRTPGVIDELQGQNFDVDARDYMEKTPLMTAAFYGNIHALEFLLRHGADVNAVDFRNSSAIFFAIRYRCENCVRMLLESGSNVQLEIRRSGYSTTLELIQRENYVSCELVLSQLALQDMQGKPITQIISAQINSDDRFKKYFDSSKQLLSMKMYKSVSLLDLVGASNKKLERYVVNEELVSTVQEAIKILSTDCFYRTSLEKRIPKAIRIATLKKQAACIVCKIMHISYETFPLVADKAVDYLAQQDMRNLIDASL